MTDLPLFPSEAQIAREVLGPGRGTEARWRDLAVIWERHGLPAKDPIVGARYWPAVRAWLDRNNGLDVTLVPVPKTDDKDKFPCRQDRPQKPQGSRTGEASRTGSRPRERSNVVTLQKP